MNETTYRNAFGKEVVSKCYYSDTEESLRQNVEQTASQFMELDGVKGVVQNTTLKAQIKTIVNPLAALWQYWLISVLLALVVLFVKYQCGRTYPWVINHWVHSFFNREVTLYTHREPFISTGIFWVDSTWLGLHQYMVEAILWKYYVQSRSELAHLCHSNTCWVIIILDTASCNQIFKKVNMSKPCKICWVTYDLS